ncbi:hypothetical protein K443DRAFT_686767 [Laccaria amethystina LaAM-08-1]|uniref:Uncharacterized protein n=1 Tax=Laccaria amethystina LaAM-08-1 TaxID=1095629 RepID=A0A0C9WLM4_9AGAR|nr:hypothetical protein K443DRAFT_686767 [Laccaria amethystina LaAM-08-1]
MQVIQTDREQAMQLEAAHEESLEFAQLLQSGRLAAAITPHVAKPSTEEQEMWENYATAEKTFDTGLDPSLVAAEERKRLEKVATDSYLWSVVDNLSNEVQIDNELLLDELEQFDILNEILQDTHLDSVDVASLVAEDVHCRTFQSKAADAWAPYESKMIISNSLMNVFLWILQEAGAWDVPSLHRLREVQASIRKSSGVPTMQHTSPKGNVYSMNDPRTLVAMDWANPSVCNHLCRHPVIPSDGVISEVYHAQKWRKDMDRNMLSPMYDGGDRHYYIDEVARLKSGEFVIPIWWLEDEKGEVFADAYTITTDTSCRAHVNDSHPILIKARDLQRNFLDLKDMNLLPTWSNQTLNSGYPTRMPNPDHALAEGDPLYTSWIDLFCDDVSRNQSKNWNKHWNTYMNHRNLPRKLLQQEFHTHFVSSSPVASIPEQFHGVKQAIESTHKKPVKVRHGLSGAQMRFKIYVNSGPGDNPNQSEICGHIGGNGNHPCRKCHVGGLKEFKETDAGYHSLFQPAALRSGKETLADVESQVKLACLGIAQNAYTQHWINFLIGRARTLKKEHPERTVADIEKELLNWVEEHKADIYNPFLTLEGFDPAADTPVEILHTILLGIVKYLWHGSHSTWSAKQKETYSLKTIAQVNVFHVYDLVDSTQLLLTKAVGELSALLWVLEIRNMDEYLGDVELATANVLDLFAMVEPSKMTAKIKLHLLAHLKADILRFGPLLGVATESFECFNAIFRYCSIYSNHLTPSRDIAFQLASQEGLKHRLTGGWWKSVNGEWEQSGPSLCNFIHASPTLQALVGWTTTEPLVNGSFTLEPLKHDQNKRISAINSSEDAQSEWTHCQYTVAHSGDKCQMGSWIFTRSPLDARELVTGHIVEILANSKGDCTVVVLDTFQVILSARHHIYGMPMLARPNDETAYIVICSTGIDFLYNVQHDCPLAKCTASGKQALMQERVELGLFKTSIEHKPIERFVINTHVFHNAHLLRATLPRSIISPVCLQEDWYSLHAQCAETFRVAKAH